jgi:tRNA pseudouridine synthase 10
MGDVDRRDPLEVAEQLLSQYPLCDECLGRQFAWLSTGTSNGERGRSIKLVLSMKADELIKSGDRDGGTKLLISLASNGMFEPAKLLVKKNGVDYSTVEKCHLCFTDGASVFDRIPAIVERAVEVTKDIEFSTFLAGCTPITSLAEREDELRARNGLLRGEPLKAHFNRELGKQVQKALGKAANFQHPDLVIVYDMASDSLVLQINPIFLYGRYRKLVRGIPQSRWDCSECRGKGCESCGGTGRRYPDSVSEYVGIPVQIAAQGSRFKFHAAGREDIDALMLGSGRPFVVEVSEPRARTLDLDAIVQTINEGAAGKVEVSGLQFTDREYAQRLKHEASHNIKEYAALMRIAESPTDEDLRKAEVELSGVEINQRTPTRVSHRRRDLVRKKWVYEVILNRTEDGLLQGTFKVQGGTYVKELISGDSGRTTPSLSGILQSECVCVELTVTSIHGPETDHNA